ncbi:MAG: hypothetical protein GX275_05560 [Clostridiales bacterium]|nr:hypothetical protein [Clostridiales bacterium]
MIKKFAIYILSILLLLNTLLISISFASNNSLIKEIELMNLIDETTVNLTTDQINTIKDVYIEDDDYWDLRKGEADTYIANYVVESNWENIEENIRINMSNDEKQKMKNEIILEYNKLVNEINNNPTEDQKRILNLCKILSSAITKTILLITFLVLIVFLIISEEAIYKCLFNIGFSGILSGIIILISTKPMRNHVERILGYRTNIVTYPIKDIAIISVIIGIIIIIAYSIINKNELRKGDNNDKKSSN